MSRKFSNIYRRLVSNENDIVGHIAYSLYKLDKSKFVEEWKSQHPGEMIPEEEICKFHDICMLETNIDRYKLQARHILQSFLHTMLDNTVADIENDTVKKHKKLLEEVIQPIKPRGFWTQLWFGVIQSIIGAIVFGLIIAGFAYLANSGN